MRCDLIRLRSGNDSVPHNEERPRSIYKSVITDIRARCNETIVIFM